MSLLDHVVSVVLAAVLGAASVAGPAPAPPAARADGLVVGRDVSWPNCPKGLGIPSRRTMGNPMPPASARFVVIGLTNGPAFYPNPCLDEQVAFARLQHLWVAAYAVVTHPTRRQLAAYGASGPHPASDRDGRLRNTGWAQARQNLDAMEATGLRSPIVWVDVEPVSPPAPWSGRVADNRAVLTGAVAAYRDAGLRVGFYSTPSMWRSIVGPVRYGFPEWRTAGLSTRRAALSRCRGPQFQGGRGVIAQWYSTREDFDVLCPGRPAQQVLAEFFTRL